jgi:uncharacterized protein YyaL (SSP411 family)
MPNRLINETSPYLLQHAHNPVDWHPWGEEAFERARAEGKPVFLSIGYSACHWCHVMEQESFENEAIAKLLNDNFVSIKVDREERPDVDAVYMDAVQAMSGHGGWPLSVFLTPDGRPFFGGTYYPPEDVRGMPGFPRVLEAVLDAYRSRRAQVFEAGDNVIEHVRQAMAVRGQSGVQLTPDLLTTAFRGIVSNYDKQNGGFGTAPKFPQPMLVEFLLRYHLRDGNQEALAIAQKTLEKMAAGGVYDQLGGGFHRYSTDARWLVPHFEKMLYDNALLPAAYLHAYQLTGREDFRRVTEGTLDWLLREMRAPEGGFYSTLDADSEGEEGKFYVWSKAEIESVLGSEKAALLNEAYGVTEAGNFEHSGSTVLNRVRSASELAKAHGLSEHRVEGTLAEARERLFEVRNQRVRPGRDEKVLTGWNGLLLQTLAEASAVLDRADYREAAAALAEFLLSAMRREDGRLLRSYKDGQARILGYLEDYAFLAGGLLTLFETTFDRRWLDESVDLASAMLDLFWSPKEETFYDTGKDAETLVVRPRTVLDNALPSGGSAASGFLLRLASLTGDDQYSRVAVAALRTVYEYVARFPSAVGHWLSVLDYHLSTPKEIAIIGPLGDERTRALLDTVTRRYMPNKVLVGVSPEDLYDWGDLPVLEGRMMVNGFPTAFVCENFVCKLPVTDPEALAAQLSAGPSGPEALVWS